MAAAGATMAVSNRPDDYRGPVAFALALHVALMVMLSLNVSFCEHRLVLPAVPAHVKAVVLERRAAVPDVPVAAPLPEPVQPAPQPPEPKPPAPKKPEPPKPAPKKPEPKKPEPKKPAPKPPAPAKPAPKEAAPKEAAPKPARPAVPPPDFSDLLAQEERALAARDASRRAADEQASRESAARAAQDQKLVEEYKAQIIAEIARRWNRPPSARNGMQVELRITLLPGGEVLDVQLVKSSGDAAFDRSAENAVRLAGRLPVPADPALFNAGFRQLKLKFKPEDLKQ